MSENSCTTNQLVIRDATKPPTRSKASVIFPLGKLGSLDVTGRCFLEAKGRNYVSVRWCVHVFLEDGRTGGNSQRIPGFMWLGFTHAVPVSNYIFRLLAAW